MEWKSELDAIVGARHGGRITSILSQLKGLDARYPHTAEINFQLAWTLEASGQEAEALPYYEKAVALGLAPNELSGAMIGWANALRLVGQTQRAVEVLESARRQFPENREIEVFRALALHEGGQYQEAFQQILSTLLEATEDIGITAYQRALRYHMNRLQTQQVPPSTEPNSPERPPL